MADVVATVVGVGVPLLPTVTGVNTTGFVVDLHTSTYTFDLTLDTLASYAANLSKGGALTY